MLTLGIDTALSSCSVAVLDGALVLASRSLLLEKGHAEHLAPLVVEALAEVGIAARELDRAGVVVGPGGFAGVRVGVAFARGLAIGTRLKTVGMTSLEALARGVAEAAGPVAAVVNANRGEVYAALYDADAILIEPFVAAPEAALQRLIAAGANGAAAVGDGVRLVDPRGAHFRDLGAPPIDPAVVARFAAAALAPTAAPAPLYLRDPDA
ncbi:MAG: tRNA (adenosine(37)-N6)-threonylcarbamoyltransferase complex dimerization subunit type 1 TsaB [Parvularculaceae bacterium]